MRAVAQHVQQRGSNVICPLYQAELLRLHQLLMQYTVNERVSTEQGHIDIQVSG